MGTGGEIKQSERKPRVRSEDQENTMNLYYERIKYISAVVIYGTIGLFLRYVDIPSEIVAFSRGIIGSIFIFLFLIIKGRRISAITIRKNLIWLIISGICLGLNWIFLFAAYMHTTVAIASLCTYMAPIIVIMVAPIILHEPLEKQKIPCVVAALVGIILVSGVWNGSVGNISGVLMGLAAALGFVGLVLCNRKIREIDPFDKAILQLAVSALTILPFVLVSNWGESLQWNMKSIVIILILGIVHTGIAYCLYFSGLGNLPVHTIAILGYLEPVVSVFCSAVFLHEPMGIAGWIGAVLILGAAVISERMR